jgi:hypothetical protein
MLAPNLLSLKRCDVIFVSPATILTCKQKIHDVAYCPAICMAGYNDLLLESVLNVLFLVESCSVHTVTLPVLWA